MGRIGGDRCKSSDVQGRICGDEAATNTEHADSVENSAKVDRRRLEAVWREASQVGSGKSKEATGKSQYAESLKAEKQKQGRRGDDWMDDDARRL